MKKIRARDTETQSWQRVARRRIAAARACGRAETQTPSAIGLRFRPSVCPDSRPAAPACVRRVARLAACAPDLRVSVSPWQNPWTRSQRDIVADFGRFSLRALRSLRSTLFSVSRCLRGKTRGRSRSVTSWRALGALCSFPRDLLSCLVWQRQNITIGGPACVYPEPARHWRPGALMKAVLVSGSFVFFVASGAYAQPAATPGEVPARALVTQYCAGCHNDAVRSGGVSLARLDVSHAENDAELAEKMIRKLRAGLMPPPGARRPGTPALNAVAAALESSLDAAAAVNPNPGRPALHRLNRFEYANSVRDLLALDVDPATLLPPDDSSHGFDNMAEVLNMSPTLMEAYVRAAGKISRMAL